MANEKLLVPYTQQLPTGYTDTGRTEVRNGWSYRVAEHTHEDVRNIHVSERVPKGYEVITSGVRHGQPYYEIGKRIK